MTGGWFSCAIRRVTRWSTGRYTESKSTWAGFGARSSCCQCGRSSRRGGRKQMLWNASTNWAMSGCRSLSIWARALVRRSSWSWIHSGGSWAGGVFQWGSSGGSWGGVGVGAVVVVFSATLGDSSLGVRVGAILDSCRCRSTAWRRASVFACWSADLACAALASAAAASRAAACWLRSSAWRVAFAWAWAWSRSAQVRWRSSTCCCCCWAVCCVWVRMSWRRA